uniref:Uncharacterized protein n=1 Tax=Arundo donax TaxID=35708 RepID=A0A0A9EDG4_ARUDO
MDDDMAAPLFLYSLIFLLHVGPTCHVFPFPFFFFLPPKQSVSASSHTRFYPAHRTFDLQCSLVFRPPDLDQINQSTHKLNADQVHRASKRDKREEREHRGLKHGPAPRHLSCHVLHQQNHLQNDRSGDLDGIEYFRRLNIWFYN